MKIEKVSGFVLGQQLRRVLSADKRGAEQRGRPDWGNDPLGRSGPAWGVVQMPSGPSPSPSPSPSPRGRSPWSDPRRTCSTVTVTLPLWLWPIPSIAWTGKRKTEKRKHRNEKTQKREKGSQRSSAARLLHLRVCPCKLAHVTCTELQMPALFNRSSALSFFYFFHLLIHYLGAPFMKSMHSLNSTSSLIWEIERSMQMQIHCMHAHVKHALYLINRCTYNFPIGLQLCLCVYIYTHPDQTNTNMNLNSLNFLIIFI